MDKYISVQIVELVIENLPVITPSKVLCYNQQDYAKNLTECDSKFYERDHMGQKLIHWLGL